MKITYLLQIVVVCLISSFSISQTNYVVLSSNYQNPTAVASGTNITSPVNNFYKRQVSHMVYTACELKMLGVPAGASLNSLAWYIMGNPTNVLNNYTISLKHVTVDNVANNLGNTGWTTVYTGQVNTNNTLNSWLNFSFSTPFIWDGTSNVGVQICYNATNWSSTGTLSIHTPQVGSAYVYNYYRDDNDGVTNCALTPNTTASTRPDVRFGYVGTSTINYPIGAFGNNAWNVTAYNDLNSSYNAANALNLTSATIRGTYVSNVLNINTSTEWSVNGAPSEHPNYIGCPVNADRHIFILKRKGFPCGLYQLKDITWDDAIRIYVNGSIIYENTTCCGMTGLAWEGMLDENSTMEIRVAENTVGSHLNMTLLKKDLLSIADFAGPDMIKQCNPVSIGTPMTQGNGTVTYTTNGHFNVNSTSYIANPIATINVNDIPNGVIVNNVTVQISYESFSPSYRSEFRVNVVPPTSIGVPTNGISPNGSTSAGIVSLATIATYNGSALNPEGTWTFQLYESLDDGSVNPDATVKEIRVVINYSTPTIQWTPATGLSSTTIANPTANPTSSTTYTMNLMYNGCAIASDEVMVTVQPLTISPANPSICVNSTVDLSTTVADFQLPTGGTITTQGNYRIHTFNSSGVFQSNQPIANARVLVVGGGGGGGFRHAGGGGAGGYIHVPSIGIPNGTQSIVVGAGGAGSNGTSSGENGGKSQFMSIIALGGGGGGTNGFPGRNGASGGGGSNGSFGGAAMYGQGYAGGNQNNGNGCCYAYGNGGGGSAGVAANSSTSNGSAGGAGTLNDITGTSIYYAAGGGGGRDDGSSALGYAAGTGGSGIGGGRTTMQGANGTANLGHGGGGGGANGTSSGNGGNGGSGVVIIRYQQPKWTSSNTAVATVNELSGLVTGVAPGTATITYTSISGCTVSTTVTVNSNATASITTAAQNICHGNEATIGGNVNATGNWVVTLNTGNTVSGTGSGTWSTTVIPTATTTYTLTSLSSACSTVSGSTTVTLPSPSNVLANNGESATCFVGANQTVHFYHPSSGRYISSVKAGATALGNTTATAYIDNISTAPFGNPIFTQACDDASFSTAVLGRHWVIQPTTNAAATVILPYYNQELSLLSGATPTSTNPNDDVLMDASNLGLSKYSGPANVNNLWIDNCPPSGSGGTTYQAVVAGNYGDLPNYLSSWNGVAAKFSRFPITGFSEFWLHASSPLVTPLSVQLEGFSVQCDETVIQVKWKTANEINNDYFILERSRDGIQWNEVAKRYSDGSAANYSVIDQMTNAYYYRLKQYDVDGKMEIFGPIMNDCFTEEATLSVYPNPTTDHFAVALNSPSLIGNLTIDVHDVTGKVVLSQEFMTVDGTAIVYFNEVSLARGTYVVSIREKDKGEIKPVKLIIN